MKNWRILIIITTMIFFGGLLVSFLIFHNPNMGVKNKIIQTNQISKEASSPLGEDRLFVKTRNIKVRKLQTIPLEGIVNDVQSPVRILSDVDRPRTIKRVDPIYPEEAKKEGIKGIVHLEIQTDIFGRVINVNVAKPIDSRLYLAAKEAIQKWVFEPIIVNNRPREAIFTICFRFEK